MRQLICLIGILFFITHTFAQSPVNSLEAKSDSIIKKRGELFLSFDLPVELTVTQVSRIVSIDKISGSKIWAYANRKELERLKSLGVEYNIELQIPINFHVKSSAIFNSWNQYPTYTQYDSLMRYDAATYPNLCSLYSIGNSVQGRNIYFMRLGNNPKVHVDKPSVMYSGGMHGNELTSFMLILQFMDYLIRNYNDPQVKSLMDTAEIWICPLANPDGTYNGGDSTVEGAIRYNANGFDLNRNFPDFLAGEHPDGDAVWEPETVAMMTFMNEHNFTLSANFHSGAAVVNYPWDSWIKPHADSAWFYAISRQYADTVQAYSPPGSYNELDNGVTDGYEWYQVLGGRQDYQTYYRHGREVTLEFEDDKMIPDSMLPYYWNYHYRSLLNYLKQVNYGIRGKVINEFSGTPIKACITIPGHDYEQSQIYTDSITGMYFRMLVPGTYSLLVSAPGYLTDTILNVQLSANSQIRVDAQLKPSSTNIPSEDSAQQPNIYPNPASTQLFIHFPEGTDETVTLFISDFSGKILYSMNTTWEGTDILVPIENLTDGVYILGLKGQSVNKTFKFIKI